MFLRQDLDELVAIDAWPAVSLYLPTHAAGREIRQDPVRLRRLLAAIEDRLGKLRGVPAANPLLAPARALLDPAFWRHQESGLAVFLAPDFSRVHKLPIAVPEAALIGRHFHIRPLLPLLEGEDAFWLLALSAARARLYRGTRWRLDEAALDLPGGIAAVRGESEYEETHYASPTGRQSGLTKAQSFGPAPDEQRKSALIEFLRRVAKTVEPEVKRRPAPVILAASPEIRGHFRDLAGWPEIEPDGIAENPDPLDAAELHRRAGAVMAEKAGAARAAALDRLDRTLGTGKASSDAETLLAAARDGRIDMLFLAPEAHLWGQIEDGQPRVAASSKPAEDAIDLLDEAALLTLRAGGRVLAAEPARLPEPHRAAAIFRY